jgi:hypothetical protein
MIHLSFRNVFNYIDSPANISNYRDLQEHETYKLIHIQAVVVIDSDGVIVKMLL